MQRILEEGEASLGRTPELMAVLKEAGVVDAGGKGFVRMLEGVVRYIQGDPILAGAMVEDPAGEPFIPAAGLDVAGNATFNTAPRCWSGATTCPRPTRCGRPCTHSVAPRWWP